MDNFAIIFIGIINKGVISISETNVNNNDQVKLSEIITGVIVFIITTIIQVITSINIGVSILEMVVIAGGILMILFSYFAFKYWKVKKVYVFLIGLLMGLVIIFYPFYKVIEEYNEDVNIIKKVSENKVVLDEIHEDITEDNSNISIKGEIHNIESNASITAEPDGSVEMEGTISEEVPKDYEIWIFVKNGLLMWPKEKVVVNDRDWSISFFEDFDKPVDIHLVAINKYGQAQINMWKYIYQDLKDNNIEHTPGIKEIEGIKKIYGLNNITIEKR